jgi:hypothetical protein
LKKLQNLAVHPEGKRRVEEMKAQLFSWYRPPEIDSSPA